MDDAIVKAYAKNVLAVVSPEAVRARARLVTLKGLDELGRRLDESANAMETSELASIVGQAGKLSGAASLEVKQDNRITVTVQRSRAHTLDSVDAYTLDAVEEAQAIEAQDDTPDALPALQAATEPPIL